MASKEVAAAEASNTIHGREGTTLLSLDRISKRFGALAAVEKVTLDVRAGELTALIGPNGAGKSTLFGVIAGSIQPSGGEIHFNEVRLNDLRPHQRLQLGIGRTFQAAPPFSNMSVTENVMIGFETVCTANILDHVFRTPRGRAEESRMSMASQKHLHHAGLDVDPDLPASSLTAGQLRLLSIARILAASPRLLLLDEPAAGLNETEKQVLSNVLRALNATGMTILLIEHSMDFVMRMVDRIVVLESGQVLADGDPQAIRTEEKVISAYLGAH